MTDKEQKCKGCENTFIPYNNRKDVLFCSYSCGLSSRLEDNKKVRHEMRCKLVFPCRSCNREFHPTSAQQKYCSESCKSIALKIRTTEYITKPCGVCLKPFTSTSSKNKYCSPSCRQKGHNRKATDRRSNNREYSTYQKIWRERNNKSVRRSRYKNWYGITLEQYEAIFIEQTGDCAICKIALEMYDRNTHLDHEHSEPIKVRGILCNYCNALLGNARDNPLVLRTAADYLESSSFTTQPL